jgi:hypothetical protein
MNPQIVHHIGKPEQAYLVDLHSVVGAPAPNDKIGQVALIAIDIAYLHAGQICKIENHTYPKPCQLFAWKEMTVRNPLWRGIYPDAASAILTIPHGMETSVRPGKPLELGREAAGWNVWQFYIAWTWSNWQEMHRRGDKWTLERRWKCMQHFGYKGGFASFRQICSRMKLSVTKSAPNM